MSKNPSILEKDREDKKINNLTKKNTLQKDILNQCFHKTNPNSKTIKNCLNCGIYLPEVVHFI